MADFLLELLTEEIPARMQARAIDQLVLRFGDGLKGARLPVGAIDGFVTPRRLVIYARGLGAAGDVVSDERRGPRVDAPEAAVAGFVKSTGLARADMEERDTPKGRFLYATIVAPGRPADAILAALVPAIIAAFDWPKSMRWGAASASTASPRWVRPLSGIVALLDDAVVPINLNTVGVDQNKTTEDFELRVRQSDVVAGRTTFGHRFMSTGPIEITSAATYTGQLRAAHVMLDPAERRAVIVAGAEAAATAAGLTLIPDDGLVAENAGLTEWPVPLLGRFDPAFLDVPREVIQLTMRTNQKYFSCIDADGALAPAFVCVANIAAADGGAGVVAGNRKVLAARLADAKFFWDADRAVTLVSRLPKLNDIVFHEKIGTVADKVERVAKLARWLAESGAVPGADPQMAEDAGRLCKADLVSATVGEFPEVQGIAGGHLALVEGLHTQIAAAIRDHYKPVGPGDDVPQAPVTVAVALADKLDTLCAFFDIDELPTGSRDPFALRRAALGVLRLVLPLKLYVGAAITEWLGQSDAHRSLSQSEIKRRSIISTVTDFLINRLVVQQREAGVRHDLISASREWGTADDGRMDRVVSRATALQAFLLTPDGGNLLAGYKRGVNIVRIEEGKDGVAVDGEVDPKLLTEPGEVALGGALDTVVPEVEAAVAAEDFAGAMTALARLRPAVDAFFEHVTVNTHEANLRRNRLALLARLRVAVHSVADFSKIEG